MPLKDLDVNKDDALLIIKREMVEVCLNRSYHTQQDAEEVALAMNLVCDAKLQVEVVRTIDYFDEDVTSYRIVDKFDV